MINLKTNLQRVAIINAERYITSPVRYSTISSDDLIGYACENSGIPKAQMVSAFYALNQQIEQFVLNGHSLELGSLGYFYLSTRTKATQVEKDAGAEAVRRISVKFRQSKYLQTLLNSNVTLNTLKKLPSTTTDSGTDSGTGGSGGSGGSSDTGGESGGQDVNPLS